MNDLGTQLLKVWWTTAKGYPTRFNTTFQDFLDEVKETNAVFLSAFNSSVRNQADVVNYSDLEKAMRNFAVAAQGQLPEFPDGAVNTSIFFDVILKASKPSLLNLNFVKKVTPEVVAGTLKEVKNIALTGASLYIVFLALGVGAALYFSKRR